MSTYHSVPGLVPRLRCFRPSIRSVLPSLFFSPTQSASSISFNMDAFQSHAFSTSCWLCLQAVPLFVSPRLMVNLLAPEPRAATGILSSILHYIGNILIRWYRARNVLLPHTGPNPLHPLSPAYPSHRLGAIEQRLRRTRIRA